MEATATASTTGSQTIADLIPRTVAEPRRQRSRSATSATAPGTTSPTPQLGEIVQEIGLGLIDLGIEPGERVSILANTRPEWTYVDMAATSAGAVVVPIYQTNSPEECHWVISDSDACAIVCEDEEQLAKIAAIRDRLPQPAHGDRDRPARRGRQRRRAPTSLARRDHARGGARARAHALGRGARRAPRGRAARGPLHVHLHLRHHRPAEGLRAHARQLPRDHRHGLRGRARSRGRRSSTSTCRSPTPSRC